MAKRGRKAKLLQPDRAKRLLTALQDGQTRRAAWGAVGISEDSLARWLRKNANFAEQVTTAESYAEARHTFVIAKAAFGHEVVKVTTTKRPMVVNGKVKMVKETTTETSWVFDWRAALAWLERRRPQEWSLRRQEGPGEARQPFQFQVVYEKVLAGLPAGRE